ncbi:GNAT family N-acetyltransferase [Rossellomorea aquimaris]|uniref:GNAT family N-acetyltransferase n=1 Tax=Rossellomorea aquimaris TaxID=189382 RepID=UPI001CD37118|nr:GNAT family N-acetyltransferase [Rossellomorea aquimaris]MCA1057753.1 GNAT family N-acetyltransferase [Rossellomorea aquimaris]
MEELKSTPIDPDVRTLLSFATAHEKVKVEYDLYIHSSQRKLFGFVKNNALLGCIGIELLDHDWCEVKHIAVMPQHRGEGIGKQMIDFIRRHGSFSGITAETDEEAVMFYKKIGFEVRSLGEKYPGVKRFKCRLSMEE